MQRAEHLSAPEHHRAKDIPAEGQQPDDTVHITASEGVPVWMIPTPGAAGSSSQEQSILLPKDVMRQFLLQYIDTTLESRPELLAQFPQVFHSMQGSHVFSSSANISLSFMTAGSSSSQSLHTAQESQIPVPHPGPRETTRMSIFFGNEAVTAQQGVQIPLMPASPKMGETAAWQQPQQLAPLYRQVPMETQVPTAQTPPMIDWADIRKKLLKERNVPMIGTGDIAMPLNYDAQGQNPRWERLALEVVKDLIKAIRDNDLGSSYFKQIL